MGFLFVAAFVFGLGVLVLQFFSADSDAHELETDPAGHEAHSSHQAAMGGALGIFLSLRFWTYGALAFGLLGSLLHFLDLTSPGVAVALSVVMGIGAGLFASMVLSHLQRREVTSSADVGDTVGKLGRVLLPCSSGQPGKVRIELRGSSVDLVATTDEALIENGAHVVVVDVRGTTAHVARAPDDLVPR